MSGSFSPLRSVLLQPLISVALLVTSLRHPQEATTILSQITNDVLDLNAVQTGLKALIAVGVLYRANKYLERLALNNYVTDKTWDWSREIVLITGGSSGIGAAIVRELCQRNIQVVNVDISPPKVPESPASNVHFYKLDVSSSAAISAVAKQMRAEVGTPTVVINNAGLGGGQLVLDESDETLERIVSINLMAHFKMAKEFLPDMIERNHGHIVTVASMASFSSIPSIASYCATKAGVLAFHECLAGELKSRYGAPKVRMTSVHPMYVRTPLTSQLTASPQWKKTPQILLEPEEVASAVVAQILKGESAQLILPTSVSFVSTLRGWPHWMQVYARGLSADLVVNAT